MKKVSIKRAIAASATVFVALALSVTTGVVCRMNGEAAREHSETFTGYVSENSYVTREETARAFVDEQLGEAETAVYSRFEVSGGLTGEEIESVNASNASLARANAETITEGEHCVIYYTLSDNPKQVRADILYTDQDAYRYFAPLPESGEQPSKAYIDSVFNGNKYLNCTMQTTLSVSQLGVYNTYKQTIMLADDKAYFNQELPGFINEIYLLEHGNGIISYLKNPIDDDGKFHSLNEINASLRAQGLKYETYLTKGGERVFIKDLDGLADVTDFAFRMEADCSCFIKTDYGFAMTSDKYKEACIAVAGEEFSKEFEKFWHDYKVNFRADYYVFEGRMSQMNLTLQMAYEGDVLAIRVVTDYTGFGSTKVEIPME